MANVYSNSKIKVFLVVNLNVDKLLKGKLLQKQVFADVFQKKYSKNFAKFTGKLVSWSLFFIKLQGMKFCNFIKKRLQHRCFLVNIVKLLRTAVFLEHLRCLKSVFSRYEFHCITQLVKGAIYCLPFSEFETPTSHQNQEIVHQKQHSKFLILLA